MSKPELPEDSLSREKLPLALHVPSCGEGAEVPWGLCYKGTNPIHEGATHVI